MVIAGTRRDEKDKTHSPFIIHQRKVDIGPGGDNNAIQNPKIPVPREDHDS